ncbi:MAG: 7-cyano-7-deazaguanine synthase [Pirellulales bacterium]
MRRLTLNCMVHDPPPAVIGLLLSGGLDSSILLGQLLDQGRVVQPFYVRCGMVWQDEELRSTRSFISALACPALTELVEFDMPIADLYGEHWSFTGRGTPDATTPDEAVYLPGRNALLLVKPMVWCQSHGIGELALAPLASNPFGDATEGFFDALQTAMNHDARQPVRIVRPFAALHKREVMLLGRNLPLEQTFSCIRPRGGLHCGQCNKCAERQAAFASVAWPDPTEYAANFAK